MLRLRSCIAARLLSSTFAAPISPAHRLLSGAAAAPVSPSPSFAIQDYLVETCGLTRSQALKASTKLSHLKPPTKPDAVLAGLGLPRADIAAVVLAFLLQLYRLRKPRLWTPEELSAYNGMDEALPILLEILGSVFDVTKGRLHYGPGGGYHHFSGRDASRVFVSRNFAGWIFLQIAASDQEMAGKGTSLLHVASGYLLRDELTSIGPQFLWH